MLALDLCCGRGGWAHGLIAEGWEVVGVDLADFANVYPGRFIKADLMDWEGWRELPAKLICASPPCEEFSRYSMPWTRARNPPVPSLALIDRCRFIARSLRVPIVLENVRAAQGWLGRSAANCGPFHLWGDVPAIVPAFSGRKKESYGSKERDKRAMVCDHLARWIGRAMRPLPPSLSMSHKSNDGQKNV
jgi:hypothetical protein